MTYKELLDSVSFDEIVPFLEKKNGGVNLALYKTHYDMLRLLTPRRGEDNNDTATIANAKLDYDWEEPHLKAFPMEGDLWEVSLAKELIIAPDVNASLGEIAACCLWHTSFFGFTQEQVRETFEKLDCYSRDLLDADILMLKASKKRKMIESAGGRIPTKNEMLKIPSFRKKVHERVGRKGLELQQSKRKRRKFFRRHIRRLYNNRIFIVGTFVAACIPALSETSTIAMKDLCKLFYYDHYTHYSYQSYSGNATDRAAWMVELIEKYNALYYEPKPNAVILITVAPECPFGENDRQLTELIEIRCPGHTALLIKYDDSLGEELRLDVAFYS